MWDFDEDVIENLTDQEVQEAVTRGIVERWVDEKTPIFYTLLINCYWKIDIFFLSLFFCFSQDLVLKSKWKYILNPNAPNVWQDIIDNFVDSFQ